MTDFKIDDLVEIHSTHERVATGQILGIAHEVPHSKSWIVLLLDRYTDFMKNRPDKAIIVFESQMKLISHIQKA
jgi:hypothetical protein